MMFKKGSFEIGATVYPVAIKVRIMGLSSCVKCYFNHQFYTFQLYNQLSEKNKAKTIIEYTFSRVLSSQYDPRFGDAFWNSSKFGMVNYLLRMMSSWAIVCSVWYLPPMSREVRLHDYLVAHKNKTDRYKI